MHKILMAGAALLVVSACSDKGADRDNDGKVSADEAKAEMASGGAMKMKPGEWEVKISFDQVEGKGLPPQAMEMMKTQMAKGITTKSCMTKEESEKPSADFFGSTADSNCNFEELNRSGNSMKVAMTCKPEGGMTMTSKMDGSFAAESYTMNVEQKTEGTPMGAFIMKGKIEGRRLGDCPA